MACPAVAREAAVRLRSRLPLSFASLPIISSRLRAIRGRNNSDVILELFRTLVAGRVVHRLRSERVSLGRINSISSAVSETLSLEPIRLSRR
jgi:hypothetical protein